MSYVTKEEIERARQLDLLTFLQRYDPNNLVHIGGGAYKTRSHDSLKISNGKWCWWSHDKIGGINALEYLIKVENKTFTEAVQLVNQQCGIHVLNRNFSAPKPTPKEKVAFELPVRAPNNKRVTAYLLSRGIDMEILDCCFQNGRIYEEAQYHNAVFVGYDGATPRYATLRGTLTGNRFMREVEGSDKEYSFSITPEVAGTALHVFECAIDALSYLTQLKMQGKDWHSQSVLSLGGVYQQKKESPPTLPIALNTYLEVHCEVREIVLRLDNDTVGRSAARSIMDTIKTVSVTAEHPAQGKDYNEWLMFQKGIFSRQDILKMARNEPER